jgi:L-ascorbate metabolism protein UlaG (beta-lactamase superfamily)
VIRPKPSLPQIVTGQNIPTFIAGNVCRQPLGLRIGAYENEQPAAVMAAGISDLLPRRRYSSLRELRWNEAATVTTPRGDVLVRAIEVKHWGARWRYDRHRGYNGYVLRREGKQIIFGGDTALTESFRPLRGKGPFELAIMPIGAYQPWINAHCTPEQAVRMANDAGAKYFLPVHFKTFAFGREGVTEPIERLEAAIEPQRIGWRDIGQTFNLPNVT